jgi:hypothetical protein
VLGQKRHVLPEQNYSFSGYFCCETGENVSAFFSDKTRAVSEAEALNNIRFNICKKFNLFYKDRPFKIKLYNYTLKIINTPTVPSIEPVKENSTRLKHDPRLPFDD